MPFIEKPASLFVLVDGLRSNTAAAEFCAKRFHSQILPKLSCRWDPLEDHELLAIINESLEALDHALLESSARYAGCSIALALLLGRRLIVGTLGSCRAVLSRRLTGPLQQAKGAAKPTQWQPRTLASGENGRTPQVAAAERRRLLSAKSPLDFEAARCLHAASASSEALASQPGDAERIILRVNRAAHPFAALGLTAVGTQGGVPVARQALADCEELLAPAKANPALRAAAEAASARVKEAAAEVEAIMSMDMYVTQLLAELYYLIDEENGIPSPKRAAAMLGVQPGCGEAAAQAGIDRRYRALFSQLAAVSPDHARRSFRILDELADAASRPVASPAFWMPSGDRSTSVTRALGFRDMKRQRPLVGLELSTEILRLEDGAYCLMLLTDGARSVSEARLGEIASVHGGRPKAACLRIATEGAPGAPGEAVGTISIFLEVGEGAEGSSKASTEAAAKALQPDAKKRKVETINPGGKRRVRVSSLLLKFEGVGVSDSLARRKAPPGRTQADAERELLQVLEALHAEPKEGEAKDLPHRFAAKCSELSDCKSATNKPHADLGWTNEGQFGKEFDAATFDLQVGCLSDIAITPRGAHIFYRLA
ncbi:unnamed protein product [Polarella glacialis]|uniref:peptidylprolyl isomerase n=1 Tax=Polarella glacialis TaxID=89957 RepID=A0A813LFG5_POLGL|nr:unnamed protein product [Polarella glacialis]